jgi:hypothetical protein
VQAHHLECVGIIIINRSRCESITKSMFQSIIMFFTTNKRVATQSFRNVVKNPPQVRVSGRTSKATQAIERSLVTREASHVYGTTRGVSSHSGRTITTSTYIASPYLIASTYITTVACHSREGGNLVAQDGSSASSEGGTPASDDPDERQTQQNTSKTLSVLGYFVRSVCSVILTKEGSRVQQSTGLSASVARVLSLVFQTLDSSQAQEDGKRASSFKSIPAYLCHRSSRSI